jgi:phosphate-selective porin OprO/OprP
MLGRPYRAIVAVALLVQLGGSAAAQQTPSGKEASATDEDKLRRELEELRARQRWLERRLDAADTRAREADARAREAASAAAAHPPVPPAPLVPEDTAPRFHFGRDGFVFGTADEKNTIHLRLTLHVDGRAYIDTADQPIANTFLIRRARPFIEGTVFGVVDYRLMPDFAQGQATLADAYVDLHPWSWLRLRGGRFMVPIGLEWLQSDSTIHLIERSLATNLVPFRDLGAMLWGDIARGTFSYQLAVLNGAIDGGNGPDFDPQSDKDYVGRIFIRPLKMTRLDALTVLGFGVAASYGSAKGTTTQTALPIYRSPGQQAIFTYLNQPSVVDAVVIADGARWRVTPQLYWYIGPVGLLAEYVVSGQRVSRSGTTGDLEHVAWNLTASFVLTLEHSSYEGVVPKHPVDFRHKSFGAWELTMRYSELRLDPASFVLFADPETSVRGARNFAGGLNWYPNEHVRLMISYDRTDFDGGAAFGANRRAENALMGRLQIKL